MAKLIWDKVGERFYETGVSNCALYVYDDAAQDFGAGVAWNGITSITETPSGAEANAIYADNIKYLSLLSAEEFGASIEAYTYPEEFEECDGSAAIAPGVMVGQQARKKFCIAYKTIKGNDIQNDAYGYKLHLIYNCNAAPSERAYSTINDSPEAIAFSWEISTTPVAVTGHKPTSILTIDSAKVDAGKLASVEEALFGGDSEEAKILMPDEVLALLA